MATTITTARCDNIINNKNSTDNTTQQCDNQQQSLLLGRPLPYPTQTLDYVEALDDLDYVEALDDYVEPYSNLLLHLLVRGAAPGAASGAFAFDELLLAVPGATPGTFALDEVLLAAAAAGPRGSCEDFGEPLGEFSVPIDLSEPMDVAHRSGRTLAQGGGGGCVPRRLGLLLAAWPADCIPAGFPLYSRGQPRDSGWIAAVSGSRRSGFPGARWRRQGGGATVPEVEAPQSPTLEAEAPDVGDGGSVQCD